MEEKVLIKSEKYNIKKIVIAFVIIGAILSGAWLCMIISSNSTHYDESLEVYLRHSESGYCSCLFLTKGCPLIREHPTKSDYLTSVLFEDFGGERFLFSMSPFVGLSLISSLVFLWLRSYELVVTDKRIYGKVAWGKRVDLPVDSISATATIKTLKGVSVSTSSGKIKFLAMKNAGKIYNTINELLINRQQEKISATPIVTNTPVSDEADQLKKFKDLLDNGVITQEEFDAKKKQLLGL